MNREQATQIAESVWTIIENSSKYSFNASHALSVSYDSLYSAFQKYTYPYEFFKVMLATYSGDYSGKKRDIEKISRIKAELPNFDISLGDLKWGNNNSEWVIDKENKMIHQSLLSAKKMNKDVSVFLYEQSKVNKFKSFIDLFLNLNESKVVNANHWKALIKINYFKEFGTRLKLLTFLNNYSYFDKVQVRKSTIAGTIFDGKKVKINLPDYEHLFKKNALNSTEKSYSKINKNQLMQDYFNSIPDVEIEEKYIIKMEYEILETIISDCKTVYGEVLGVSKKNNCIRFISHRTFVEGWVTLNCELPKKGDPIILEGLGKKLVKGRNTLVATKWELIDKEYDGRF
ncbi:MAG: hypothetical protein ACRCZ9_11400 [Fusobacteriaceae bacterium]